MMTLIPERGWIYRVLGIDNGTDTVGVAVIDHDLRTKVSVVVHAQTLTASRSAYSRYPARALHRDKAFARQAVIEEFIMDTLLAWNPDIVGCESPYSHLNIRTYRSLCQSMAAMDDITYEYDHTLEFAEIPPGRAKKAVCIGRKYSNDKEVIRDYILEDPDIIAGEDVVLEELDEHSVDGISVARYLALDADRAFL